MESAHAVPGDEHVASAAWSECSMGFAMMMMVQHRSNRSQTG